MSLTKKDVTKKLLEDVVGVFNKIVLEEVSQIKTGPKVTKAMLEADIAKCVPLLEPEDKAEFSEKDLEVMAVMGWGFSEGEVEAEEVDDGTEGEVEASETEVDETEVEETETEETEEVETEKPDSTSLPSTKITRIQAVGMAFKNNPKGITRADLVSKSDAIYADSGGKPNEKEAKWAVKVVLDSIGAVGLLNESNGKFSV